MELLIQLAIIIVQLAIFGRFMSRFGYSPAWALVALIPFAPIIAMWVIAFSEWPILDAKDIRANSDTDIRETFG